VFRLLILSFLSITRRRTHPPNPQIPLQQIGEILRAISQHDNLSKIEEGRTRFYWITFGRVVVVVADEAMHNNK
jgi:hypothetical protein